MAYINGVRVFITDMNVSQDYSRQVVVINMKALLSEESILRSRRGEHDIDILNNLFQLQMKNGLWLTTPPITASPIYITPEDAKQFNRRIILDEESEEGLSK